MQANQLKPTEVTRDAMGFWTHPEVTQYLDELLGDRESLTDSEMNALENHFNIDIAVECIPLSEVDPDADGDWSGYEPTAPNSSHFLIATFESVNSDNAYFWWAKECVALPESVVQSLMEVS